MDGYEAQKGCVQLFGKRCSDCIFFYYGSEIKKAGG